MEPTEVAPRSTDPAFKRRQTWGVWNRYFLTNINARMAKPWSLLFAAAGMTPNMVSILSLISSVAGILLIAFDPGPRNVVWLGGLLLMLGLIWDHADGQVARSTGKSTPGGALLDTIIDRWVETGWIIALGLAPFVGTPRPVLFDWPAWVAVAAAGWAVHSTLYVRWANVQRDLYIIQKELRLAQATSPMGTVVIDATPVPAKLPDVKTFFVPFAFNRDATLWMLFLITLIPYWVAGLIAFAALHTMLGLEKNWYTYQDIRRPDTSAIRGMLDPDYHK